MRLRSSRQHKAWGERSEPRALCYHLLRRLGTGHNQPVNLRQVVHQPPAKVIPRLKCERVHADYRFGFFIRVRMFMRISK